MNGEVYNFGTQTKLQSHYNITLITSALYSVHTTQCANALSVLFICANVFSVQYAINWCFIMNLISHQAFHCSEPASLQVSCLPLFLSLLAYEVYYNTETAEGDALTQVLLHTLVQLLLVSLHVYCVQCVYPTMQCVVRCCEMHQT